MSGTTNGTSTGATPDIQAFVGPILQGFATSTYPLFVLLLESTFFTALLVPIILSVLYFSTAKSRRSLIWNAVLLVLCLGLVLGSYSMHVMAKPFIDPIHATAVLKDSAILASIWSLSPWIIDWVLLIRLVAVYPLRRNGVLKFIGILAFPITVKIVRLVITIIFIISYDRGLGQTSSLNDGGAAGVVVDASSHLPKVEWGLQVADNAYVSALFLWRLRVAFRGEDQGRYTMGAGDSFMARVRKLFWIAASNFVIPVCFDVVLLTLPYPSNIAMFAQLANLYVNLIGVVFATVWSTSQDHSSSGLGTAPVPVTVATRSFASDTTRRPSVPTVLENEKQGSFSFSRSLTTSSPDQALAIHVRTSRSEFSDSEGCQY